ncbi:hypothetical protein VTL71DRAFT_958 [Oculimacula yallundae]|uniref:Helix-turn-helix domain-containing protein n=1 Tax=Oculimacula yallundae TaxID=86028 RepID=A0ABR4D1G8_9HELO
MGSSSSKAASKLPSAAAVATKTARKYPTRTPPTSSTTSRSVPGEKAQEPIPQSKQQSGEQIDGATTTSSFESNPDLALSERLKSLGPVQPNPTQSNSSTFHSHSTSTSSFADPSLSASQFQPSKSNPMQTIFPSSQGPPHSRSSGSGSGSGSEDYGLGGSGASGSNPAVSLLTARYRLASEAEIEFAQTGKSTAAVGRQFLDVLTLRQILVLRDEKGVNEGEIERELGLRRGVVGRLGRKGVVGVGS